MERTKKGSKRKTRPLPTFHKDFHEPTTEERSDALGPFPGAEHAAQNRERMLCTDNVEERSSLEGSSPKMALSDLNDASLYTPKGRSETRQPIRPPNDELDWLATVPEEGQTFDEYISFLTSRSGRLRPIANAGGEHILLLPLVKEGLQKGGWPAFGPPLAELAAYTRVFFDRKVEIMTPAILRNESSLKSNAKPGTFATAAKGKSSLQFPRIDGVSTSRRRIVGRRDPETERSQYQVSSILNELAAFRENSSSLLKSFCVVGITMEDIYDGPSDLFCAGFAFGGNKVAVFSFFRYHLHIQMHPMLWHHFGYEQKQITILTTTTTTRIQPG